MTEKAMGPYSPFVITGDFVFCSGQISPNGDIRDQVEQVIIKIKNILAEAGSDLSQVVKTEVYLTNINDFEVMNEVYAKHFVSTPLPARVTVEVSRLPKDALIEMSCTAYKKQNEK